MDLWQIYGAGNNRKSLGLQVKCSVFLFHFKHHLDLKIGFFVKVIGTEFYGNSSNRSSADT